MLSQLRVLSTAVSSEGPLISIFNHVRTLNELCQEEAPVLWELSRDTQFGPSLNVIFSWLNTQYLMFFGFFFSVYSQTPTLQTSVFYVFSSDKIYNLSDDMFG